MPSPFSKQKVFWGQLSALLEKPFDQAKLLESVRKVLDRHE